MEKGIEKSTEKRVFFGENLGKVIVLNLKRGDLLVESIKEHITEAGIKNAVLVTIVGSLQKLVYHRPLNFAPSAEDEFITVNDPMEIGSVTGTIIDGQPHFHIVAADLNKTHVGHLEEGTEVLYLAEVVLCEIDGLNIQRLKDENQTAYFEEK